MFIRLATGRFPSAMATGVRMRLTAESFKLKIKVKIAKLCQTKIEYEATYGEKFLGSQHKESQPLSRMDRSSFKECFLKVVNSII